MVELSDEQRGVVEAIEEWLTTDRQVMAFGGYAGTGKTTVVSHLLRHHAAKVCAFTGKAAHVLRSKGVEGASTIHGLIYKAVTLCSLCEQKPQYCSCKTPVPRIVFKRRSFIDAKLIIVDEASMISSFLRQDLESYGVKVLYVGDHGQLGPIGNDVGVMANPDVKLETIHRQAAGSPILQFAHHVREGHAPKAFGDEATIITEYPDKLADFDVAICGFNRTRNLLNFRIRRELGFRERGPLVNERLVCLRNSRQHGVFNGMLATVLKVDREEHTITVADESGRTYDALPFWGKQFGAPKTCKDVDGWITLWDYGYALTCHKTQGSQFDNVLVVDEQCDFWSPTRWLYTAATRAAKRLTMKID